MTATKLRQLSPEEAWLITCHEAGHAVVAARLQVPFMWVVRGDGEIGEVTVGVTPSELPDDPCPIDEVSRWQQFYAGGAAAEKLLFGEYREIASRQDRLLHSRYETLWRPGRIGGWEEDVELAAAVLDRGAIERVARELDRRKQLSDEQVCKMLGCKLPWY